MSFQILLGDFFPKAGGDSDLAQIFWSTFLFIQLFIWAKGPKCPREPYLLEHFERILSYYSQASFEKPKHIRVTLFCRLPQNVAIYITSAPQLPKI